VIAIDGVSKIFISAGRATPIQALQTISAAIGASESADCSVTVHWVKLAPNW